MYAIWEPLRYTARIQVYDTVDSNGNDIIRYEDREFEYGQPIDGLKDIHQEKRYNQFFDEYEVVESFTNTEGDEICDTKQKMKGLPLN